MAWLWPEMLAWPHWGKGGWPEILHLVVLVVLYPSIEEWVFRGQIQSWLLDHRWGRPRLGPVSVANALTSLLFAMLHLVAQPPFLAMLVFIPSLVFGYARERTAGLLWPIALHGWYNLGWFLLFGLGG